MPTIKLRVIQKPASGTRSIIEPDTLPAFTFPGATRYLCGLCSSLIVRGDMLTAKIRLAGAGGPLVIHCPRCGSYVELPVQAEG